MGGIVDGDGGVGGGERTEGVGILGIGRLPEQLVDPPQVDTLLGNERFTFLQS